MADDNFYTQVKFSSITKAQLVIAKDRSVQEKWDIMSGDIIEQLVEHGNFTNGDSFRIEGSKEEYFLFKENQLYYVSKLTPIDEETLHKKNRVYFNNQLGGGVRTPTLIHNIIKDDISTLIDGFLKRYNKSE